MENSGNSRVSQSQEDVQSMKLELKARREKEAERKRKDAERKKKERLFKKLKPQPDNQELENLRSFANDVLAKCVKLRGKCQKLEEVNAKQHYLAAAVATLFVKQNLPNDVAVGGTAGMVGMPGMAGFGAHAPTFTMGNQQGLFNAAATGGFDKDGLGVGGSSSQTAGWPGMVGMPGMAASGAHVPMFTMGNQLGLFNAAAMGGFDEDGLGAGGSSSQTAGWPGMAGSWAHAQMFSIMQLCKKLKPQSQNKELENLRSFAYNSLEEYVKLKDKYKKLKEVNAKQRVLLDAAAKQFVEQNMPNDVAFGRTAGMVELPGMAGFGADVPMFPIGNQQGLFNPVAMGGFDKDELGAGGSSSQTAMADFDPFAQFK